MYVIIWKFRTDGEQKCLILTDVLANGLRIFLYVYDVNIWDVVYEQIQHKKLKHNKRLIHILWVNDIHV